MKKLIKKLIPKKILHLSRPFYHGLVSFKANLQYGFPSQKLLVIGITGTKGKTTTTVLTGRILNKIGLKTGYLSTALLSVDGEKEILNPFKNTSLGGNLLQKYLHQMVQKDCKIVVLEMSSIGLEQQRFLGTKRLNVGAVLNLFPEHIEHHGSMQNYIRAKSILAKKIQSEGVLVFNFAENQIESMTELLKDANRSDLQKIKVTKNKTYQIQEKSTTDLNELIFHQKKLKTNLQVDFQLENLNFALELIWQLNQQNELLDENIFWQRIEKSLKDLNGVAGRMEIVKQTKNLSILVDYAHEPESVRRLFINLKNMQKAGKCNKIIHILSSDGAGRDDWKKPVMAGISRQQADFTILTTDNYDENDNPELILKLLAEPFEKNELNQKVFKRKDRTQAFKKSLELTQELLQKNPDQKILVVSTGVGSEQQLTQAYKVIDWDEREKWKEVLSEANY